ncbi:hypothetical protein K504DRAFT_538229 [Pleomassaria siparia CBS 279.74]|uniref:SprT-like domain-containing protein n=1 Tax=Pleomassaria siparia CBS 279.74 TaxID=1314801 RepID=A0A6G1JVJ7_9PLEO|nr:hypothetical protein K504DRAFT_538229 [Pleomassaria siparia CBS 279.74]
MARLRKPSTLDAPILMPPPTTSKPARTSPRKTSTKSLLDTPSKRNLRYSSTTAQDEEDSVILVPKIPAGGAPGTPKQRLRVLRPVKSNSRLLRRLSDESMWSTDKDKKQRSQRKKTEGSGLGLKYSKDLARMVGRRGMNSGVDERTEMDLEVDDEMEALGLELEKVDVDVEVEVDIEETLAEDEELDQSLECCDDEEDEASTETTPVLESVEIDEEEASEYQVALMPEVDDDDDDEDEDPVVNTRRKRRPVRSRVVQSDSESEKGDSVYIVKSQSQQIPLQSEHTIVEQEPAVLVSTRPPFRKGHSTISNWAQEVIDLTNSPEPPASFAIPTLPPPRSRPAKSTTSSRPTSSASFDADAHLKFSPTPKKQRSPRKAPPISRASTPPAAPPSPTKLVSPSKKKPRIPPAPALRPSLDAFWSPVVVNTWNDKHSPSKPLASPKKEKWLQSLDEQDRGLLSDSDISFPSPTTSPRKKAAGSPAKKGSAGSPSIAQVRAQRKAFSEQKHELAASFLVELDAKITSSRISTLSRQTGGIKLVWSKTLKTTAGRANWRRETFRVRTGPLVTDFREEARHHCSIELAEKVIDDEERLYNVLAHEFCHLTTFMISEQRNNPHGAEFKAWGRQVSTAFADRGVHVTTKHSYQIEYKYIWRCRECAYEFKRHSKSVDPERHSCGRCKGRLVQIKPVPRAVKTGVDGKPKEKSEYQVFVKANFGRVKEGMEKKGLSTQMGKVMEEVAREYREEKARKIAQEVNDVELAFGELDIGDE